MNQALTKQDFVVVAGALVKEILPELTVQEDWTVSTRFADDSANVEWYWQFQHKTRRVQLKQLPALQALDRQTLYGWMTALEQLPDTEVALLLAGIDSISLRKEVEQTLTAMRPGMALDAAPGIHFEAGRLSEEGKLYYGRVLLKALDRDPHRSHLCVMDALDRWLRTHFQVSTPMAEISNLAYALQGALMLRLGDEDPITKDQMRKIVNGDLQGIVPRPL